MTQGQVERYRLSLAPRPRRLRVCGGAVSRGMDGGFATCPPFRRRSHVEGPPPRLSLCVIASRRFCPFEDERRSGLRARPLNLPPVNPPKLELPFGHSNIEHFPCTSKKNRPP